MKKLLLVGLLACLPVFAQDFSAKVKLTPYGQAAVVASPPDVPVDPNPGQTFGAGKVFQDPQLYVRYVMTPKGIDWTRTSTRWYFLPTGRTYVLMYDGQGNQTQFWGRYQIDDGGQVAVVVDDGEKVSMYFTEDRRTLNWGETTYHNIYWEEELLNGN